MDAQPDTVTEVRELPRGPIERFVPWFDDPNPLLLQDTLVTQCWSRGWELILPRRDVRFDLRAMDSCSCWKVRGALCQDLMGGERWVVADDSSLVARWRREADGLMSYWRVDRLELGVRRFQMSIADTVRQETEYIDRWMAPEWTSSIPPG
jgi:hypothetical protein